MITKLNNKLISKKWLIIFLSVLVALGLSFLLAPYLPSAVDWTVSYRPSILTIFSGESPYDKHLILTPPWGLLMLAPLALLPEAVGRVMLTFCGLAGFAFTAHKLGAKPIAIVFLLVSPPVIHCLLNGNIDWLAAIGFVLPPQIGIFFVSLKPQVGIAVAVFWLIQGWRQGGVKQVVKTFLPFGLVLLVSFIPFGLWMKQAGEVFDFWWNASLWPMSIPVGLALFVASIRKQRIEYAMAASPCLSPYVLFHSWVGVLLAIISSVPETIAAVIGLWILIVMRAFSLY